MKKILDKIVYAILALSLFTNAFLIYNVVKDEPVFKVENETVLTKNQLNSILNDNYKVAIINQKVGDYLIQLESENRNIQAPTDEDLHELSELFPAFEGYTINSEIGRQKLIEVYNVYQIYKQDDINVSQIQSFLMNHYGDPDIRLYEIYVYETTDHHHAVDVETMLKEGKEIHEVEDQFNIEFFISYTTSMDSIINHMHTNLDSDHDYSEITDMHTTNNINTYSVGDVYHVMDSGDMHVILINDILSLDNNLEHFKNLYFAQNYISVKNSIVNNLKSEYVVSYY
ncbi:hypothetical protein Amet_3899 [Alkaliphilus metalliredigens QYMF]|uniref:Uncharacterized protein n=1 Tax=Alkaliphilus metalliredigens (strain QYMF) TaxID=293826 RepID=A6TUX8_ALKMQ|nr:hypothetical protein [Alkaliphilus metalliredigens]ABR49996.1 hypothetical protein Amet_3899 [Alkaliphilus metalliredigens QYMF]